jgi:hypothetical protein
MNTVAGPKVLTTDTPPFRDVHTNTGPKLLNPRPIFPTFRVNASGVNVVSIHGGILPVHLLSDNNLLADKVGNVGAKLIV